MTISLLDTQTHIRPSKNIALSPFGYWPRRVGWRRFYSFMRFSLRIWNRTHRKMHLQFCDAEYQ